MAGYQSERAAMAMKEGQGKSGHLRTGPSMGEYLCQVLSPQVEDCLPRAFPFP